MAKTNSFLSLLDGSKTLDTTNVPAAIGGVPFVRHQFNWLLEQIAAKPDADAVNMLTGYTGVKKITPERATRLAEMVRLIKTIPAFQLATIALPAMPTPPAKTP